MKKLSVTLVMAALLGPIAFGAQTAAPAKPAMQQSKPTAVSTSTKPAMGKIHQISGQIVSISDSSLVLSSGKQKKESTFVLNQDTKREGELSTGEMAKIEYHTLGAEQGAAKVATLVQVRALKTATSKAPKSGY